VKSITIMMYHGAFGNWFEGKSRVGKYGRYKDKEHATIKSLLTAARSKNRVRQKKIKESKGTFFIFYSPKRCYAFRPLLCLSTVVLPSVLMPL
jgi:hypothetical protein